MQYIIFNAHVLLEHDQMMKGSLMTLWGLYEIYKFQSLPYVTSSFAKPAPLKMVSYESGILTNFYLTL
jgi:hypothetical protein